ncbi:LacI family transcriptional regulator [Paenibacillus sp. KQZ6P-2]|uniref:LacI family transcriptional regulator n=1 Tax=Paenibacillus mangrovi TaxID=2931978 RepID=A0A9X1WSD6_9BACL|nr:LacI family DNA-binding transcriptional regulator [Paenibacillus mangrovi]MCJ8014199.1 LacI family transcriptional regulator [Paenibacillus mangrovi]
MTKLRDIAERVGVSISTVSRAISNDKNRPVNEETKRKIMDAAIELGYQLNGKYNLSGYHKDTQLKQIACFIPQMLIDDHPYFSQVLAGIHDQMNELGQLHAIVRTSDEIGGSEGIKAFITETGVQGVVAIGWYDEELFKLLDRMNIPLLGVSLNDDRLAIPVVDCDRIFSARTAVRHLIDQGHTRIGFIGGPAYSKDMDHDERFMGYKFAMLEKNLALPEEWIIDTNWNVNNSYNMLSELLLRHPKSEWPTAFFCASDLLAIPAMRAVVEKNGRIPQDVAFVGMDDISVAQYTSPPLTSVRVPKYEIGKVAAQFMANYLDGQYPSIPKVLLPCSLIVRESSTFDRNQ